MEAPAACPSSHGNGFMKSVSSLCFAGVFRSPGGALDLHGPQCLIYLTRNRSYRTSGTYVCMYVHCSM